MAMHRWPITARAALLALVAASLAGCGGDATPRQALTWQAGPSGVRGLVERDGEVKGRPFAGR